jgi:hypothetical protein
MFHFDNVSISSTALLYKTLNGKPFKYHELEGPKQFCIQRVTKSCRLSFLNNNAPVIRVQMQGEGGSCGVSANEYSCAHHVTWSPKKLWRYTSIFNLCVYRKALKNSDETKTQYKCVKVDSFKCCAAVWLNDETLMVEKPNHEHNHGPPLLEMLARNVLGFCFSAKFIQLLIHW